MALAESIRSLFRGDGLDKAYGYLYLSQDEIDRARDVESRLDALNRRAFDAGKWSEEKYLESSRRLQSSTLDAMLGDPEHSPAAGFREGLRDGASNVQGAIKGAIAAPINFTLGAIPWQVWAIAAAWAAWRLGLLDRILRR